MHIIYDDFSFTKVYHILWNSLERFEPCVEVYLLFSVFNGLKKSIKTISINKDPFSHVFG